MLATRLSSTLAVLALVGLAACGGGEEEAPDAVMTDTVTTPGTETVQVPVTDTAIVQTEVSVDTTVEVDTTVVEGEARSQPR